MQDIRVLIAGDVLLVHTNKNMVKNTRWVLAKRPTTSIGDDVFRREVVDAPSESSLNDNEILVRVEHLSLDPAMRGWLRDVRSYIKPVQINEVMRAQGLGSVLAVGKHVKNLKLGDKVEGTFGWQEYAVVAEKTVTKRAPPPGAKLVDYLGTLGMPGKPQCRSSLLPVFTFIASRQVKLHTGVSLT